MTELADTAPAAGTLGHPSRRSALGELLQYRPLVAMLVVRELKVRYKRSIFGLLWTMLNPLLLMVVYTVVFATIMKAPQRNFAIFLLSGLLPWLFFSIAVLQGLHSILVNQELIRKVRLPQAVFPLSVVGSNLVNFVLSLAPNSERAHTGFVRRVMTAALPSGLVVRVATFTSYLAALITQLMTAVWVVAVVASAFLAVTVKLPAVPAVVAAGKPLTAKLPQIVSLIKTETLLPKRLAVTASSQPSPLKSPAATAEGYEPAA